MKSCREIELVNIVLILRINVFFISGAGGSIGSEIVRQVIEGAPKKIVLFELSEINLYSIQSEAEAIIKTKDFSVEIVWNSG